jgi:hypothetical protein
MSAIDIIVTVLAAAAGVAGLVFGLREAFRVRADEVEAWLDSSGPYHYALFDGPDLAEDFGHDAQRALAFMAAQADAMRKDGGDFALIVSDAQGMAVLALVDARADG